MKRQRGAVVLELALVLPVLLTMLTIVLFYGRITYNYDVAQKAARDGARYLASVAAANIRNTTMLGHELNLTQNMVLTELDAMAGDALVFLTCDGTPCPGLTGALPAQVTVTIVVQIPNILPGYAPDLPTQRLYISHTMRYVGY
ncbi:TadE-like protein [Duganella sacchari]|uniref:TadE-like protein n=1 Tax=Duganella sacchari TaxID=551987 RepID=A0A1M7I7C5_9BURK|nr:TadE family protein [Duganella sacchari]SHM36585.1 TadE-like protein [Duganella sacchari]